MARLKKLEQSVRRVLALYPDARGDDFVLVYRVYQGIKFDAGSTYFNDLMTKHRMYNLPSFESITRARRKLQAENPELRADTVAQAIRSIAQDEYKQYALGLDQ